MTNNDEGTDTPNIEARMLAAAQERTVLQTGGLLGAEYLLSPKTASIVAAAAVAEAVAPYAELHKAAAAFCTADDDRQLHLADIALVDALAALEGTSDASDPAACRALLWAATLGLITESGSGRTPVGGTMNAPGDSCEAPGAGQQPR